MNLEVSIIQNLTSPSGKEDSEAYKMLPPM
jgi:hypothetical protein